MHPDSSLGCYRGLRATSQEVLGRHPLTLLVTMGKGPCSTLCGMQYILTLLAPGLIPSWDFFKSVEASPRVEWRLLSNASRSDESWHPFRPRPAQVSIGQMIARLFWNPAWNETLFAVSLAERILETPSAHSITELTRCIARDVGKGVTRKGADHLQFRLILVARQDQRLVREVAFISAPLAIETWAT